MVVSSHDSRAEESQGAAVKLSSHDSKEEESQRAALLQEHAYQELKEILYTHMSQENMDSCAKIIDIKPQKDPRDFTRSFLHHFVKTHHAPMDILEFLESLVTYFGEYKCLKACIHKLEWLISKTRLERKVYHLCQEGEMGDFLSYLTKKMGNVEELSQLNQYSNTRVKLTYLMDLVLQSPKYYNILQTFFRESNTLKKYVLEGGVRDDVMLYVSIFRVFCSCFSFNWLNFIKRKILSLAYFGITRITVNSELIYTSQSIKNI